MMNRFVFTCGDINGIGPEIVIKTLNKITSQNPTRKFYLSCPINIFEETISSLKPGFKYELIKDIKNETPDYLTVLDIGRAKQNVGKPTVSSGKASFRSLETSYNLLITGKADAVITAPVSKTALNKAGIKFRGQTEIFADWTKTRNYVMTFLSQKMNAALLTTHYPLKKIPNLLKTKKLEAVIDVLIRTLKIDLGIYKPRIAVLGLNPHAGENGIIGREEIEVITPVIRKYSKKIMIIGPFSPDAFFANKLYKDFNLVLGMYHDQVLIPYKLLNFGVGVNYTAGLPIVRTSPDHGVAYDIAEKYIADENSMLQAFKYAERIVINRKKKIDEK